MHSKQTLMLNRPWSEPPPVRRLPLPARFRLRAISPAARSTRSVRDGSSRARPRPTGGAAGRLSPLNATGSTAAPSKRMRVPPQSAGVLADKHEDGFAARQTDQLTARGAAPEGQQGWHVADSVFRRGAGASSMSTLKTRQRPCTSAATRSDGGAPISSCRCMRKNVHRASCAHSMASCGLSPSLAATRTSSARSRRAKAASVSKESTVNWGVTKRKVLTAAELIGKPACRSVCPHRLRDVDATAVAVEQPELVAKLPLLQAGFAARWRSRYLRVAVWCGLQPGMPHAIELDVLSNYLS